MQKKSNDPIPPLLEQIGILVNFMRKNVSTSLESPLDPALQKRLEVLEDLIERFREVTMQRLQKEGISTEEIMQKVTEHPEQLKPHEKELLRKSTQLSLDVMIMRRALQSAKTFGIRSQDFSKELAAKKVTKKHIKQRTKKFKKMGGDSKWMPL